MRPLGFRVSSVEAFRVWGVEGLEAFKTLGYRVLKPLGFRVKGFEAFRVWGAG